MIQQTIDEIKQELDKEAWFIHDESQSIIHSNICRMYMSNIGHQVTRIECPPEYTEEQVHEYLKKEQCRTKEKESSKNGTI